MYEGFYDSTRSDLYITATANSSGVAQGFLGPVPAGYAWYVDRYTTFSTTSGTPVCEVFVQPQQTLAADYAATTGSRQYRQDYTSNGKNNVSDNKSAVFVNEGQYLVVGWTGLTNGDTVQFSTQVRVHLKSLRIEDRQLQHQQQEKSYPDSPAKAAGEGGKGGLLHELAVGLHDLVSSEPAEPKAS